MATENKPRVLCVDDEAGILRSLTWLLQREFDVTTTTDPRKAMVLAAEESFDVVVSDQRMPCLTGVEVLRHVRDAAPASMRILLTGYSDLDAILASVNEGEVFRFVNKPWDNDELRRIVRLAASVARGAPAPAPAGSPSGDARRPHVLLVDSDPAACDIVRMAVGDSAELSCARNVHEAVSILDRDSVAVLVTETGLDDIDASRLINLLKRERPELVTVVMTDARDAALVIRLINHGQIYRFIPKPARAGLLRITIEAALAKHRQIEAQPAISRRHDVEPLGGDSRWLDSASPAMPSSGAAAIALPERRRGASSARSDGGLSAFLRRLIGR